MYRRDANVNRKQVLMLEVEDEAGWDGGQREMEEFVADGDCCIVAVER